MHVISLTVENRFGMLARIAGLFSARGYNINSLVVAPTEDQTKSRLILTVSGDERIIEQITKQLNKLIGVIKVTDFFHKDILERELLLAKIPNDTRKRSEILQVLKLFQGKVVLITRRYLTVELIGKTSKIDEFIKTLKPYGIKEMVRTGKVALSRE